MPDEAFTRFKVTYRHAPRAGRLALVTMDNGLDHRKPNVFGGHAIASLRTALDEIEGQDDVRGLLLTGKPFVFAAGADLDEFARITTPEAARAAARAGHEAFGRLRALPIPTLAAINGACIGGGLEIALHCDYRTLSTAANLLGFSEVFLSIVPAWGGTQLAPRVAGGRAALQTIVHDALANSRFMNARQANERGFVDRLVPAVDFVDESVALLERIVAGEERIQRSAPDNADLDAALADARKAADDRTHGATRAPYLAIDLIEHAARGGDLSEGLGRERDALAELLPTREAQASVYSFRVTQQRVRKQPWRPQAEAHPVNKVAVVGAGLMGAQLGALFLQRLETPLVMRDIDQSVLDRARAHIEGALDERAQRGRMSAGKADFLKSIVTYALDDDALAGSDFVLEAVLEDIDLKRRIFTQVEPVVSPHAVLATNTSSLSVSQMASGLHHPERVVGFHFFNPVTVLPLLEIVRAEHTDEATLATAFELSKRLRKSGVLCADTPAFIANRLIMRFNGAAMAALRRGNSFTDIDDAMKALGLPMGPFELLGFVGLEVAHHTARTLHGAFGDRFPLDDNLRRIVAAGVDGIYDWSRGRVPHDVVGEAVEVDEGAEALTAEQIRQAALEAVAEEARIMLDDNVVADGRDIDTAMLLGAGWPFFVGGPCRYADDSGLSEKLFGRRLLGEEDKAFA